MDTLGRDVTSSKQEEKTLGRQSDSPQTPMEPPHAVVASHPSHDSSSASTTTATSRPTPLYDVEKNVLATTEPSVARNSSSPSGDGDAAACATPPSKSLPPLRALSFLDRFLVLWIFLAMALGIVLSNTVPGTGEALQRSTFVGVSVPIAVGLLVMMYPILCKVRFESMHLLLRRRELWLQLLLSLVVNWIFAPLLMTGLAWAFLPDRPELREGLIFVGIARCIAMVLIWTDLAGGDGDYCAVLVAVNSVLQMVLFAPLAVLYVKVIGGGGDDSLRSVSYALVARSVGVFLGIPLAAAIATRLTLYPLLGGRRYAVMMRFLGPWSLLGLLYTVAVLFASQGRHVVQQITSVLRVCAPLIVYFAITFAATTWVCRRWFGLGYRVSCAQSFTAASNNFELAIAVAVATFGAGSEQALASAVGPLIEVPVLVALVYVVRWLRRRWSWED